MNLPVWFQAGTYAVLGALLLADLLLVSRTPHTPGVRESALWVGFYVGLALLFALGLHTVSGPQTAAVFVAGWLTEYSLSVDNLFVFVMIMSRFAVPRQFQQKVLMIGIILSLVLRGGFIVGGAEIIDRFAWVFYAFGAYLLYTAIQLLRGNTPDEVSVEDNAFVRLMRLVLPVDTSFETARLTTPRPGAPGRALRPSQRQVTPMVLVFTAIGTTDLLFALDSIPAIFGLTTDPFIVFTATLFALMGLRQLFFLLGGLLDRVLYLSQGLAVILGFIGVKLVLDALRENRVPFINGGQPVEWAWDVPISISLGVIVLTLAVVITLSLLDPQRRAKARASETISDGSDSDDDVEEPPPSM